MSLTADIENIFYGTIRTNTIRSVVDGNALEINGNYTLPFADGSAGQVFRTDGNGVISFATLGGGSGDVVGAASSTDNALVRFDGVTGKAIQNSSVIIDDTDTITGITSLTSGNLTLGSNAIGVINVNGNINLIPNGTGNVTVLNSLLVDTIGELTGTAGVTIDGILVKDSEISSVNKLTVDNIDIDGNIISSTDVNGDITLTPNGTGDVIVSSVATASRLLSVASDKAINSVSSLTSWVNGTANRVTVSNDGDGSITLSGPQDLATGSSPTFNGLSLTSLRLPYTWDVDKIELYGSSSLNRIGVDPDGCVLYQADSSIQFLTANSIRAAVGSSGLSVVGRTQTDTITENNSGVGVTIEGILLKDTIIENSNQINVDNLRLDGNTVSSTDTNGDINLTPDGTGSVVITNDINVDTINEKTGASGVTIDGILVKDSEISSVNKLTVDNIEIDGNTIISTDTNGNITLDPNGTGQVIIDNTSSSQTFPLLITGGSGPTWEAAVSAIGSGAAAVYGVSNNKAIFGGHNATLSAWADVTYNQGNTGNVGFFTVDPSASHGAAGVIYIGNRSTGPTGNPSGGGILYTESGALKYRGSSGTDTTLGNANPHCPVCGKDFGMEYSNPEMGYCFLCIPCMIDELGFDESPWFLTEQPQYRKDDECRICQGETKYVDGKLVKCKPTECLDQSYKEIKEKWENEHDGKSYKKQMLNGSLRKQIKNTNSEIKNLNTTVKHLESEIDNLSSKNSSLQQTVNSLNKKNTIFENMLNNLINRVDKLENKN